MNTFKNFLSGRTINFEGFLSEVSIENSIKYFDNIINTIKKDCKPYTKKIKNKNIKDVHRIYDVIVKKMQDFYFEFSQYREQMIKKIEDTSKTDLILKSIFGDFFNFNKYLYTTNDMPSKIPLTQIMSTHILPKSKSLATYNKKYDYDLVDGEDFEMLGLNVYCNSLINAINNFWNKKTKKALELLIQRRKELGVEKGDMNPIEFKSMSVSGNKNWRIVYPEYFGKDDKKNNKEIQKGIKRIYGFINDTFIKWLKKEVPYILDKKIQFKLVNDFLAKGTATGLAYNRNYSFKGNKDIYVIELSSFDGIVETLVHEVGHIVYFELVRKKPHKEEEFIKFFKNKQVKFTDEDKATYKRHIGNALFDVKDKLEYKKTWNNEEQDLNLSLKDFIRLALNDYKDDPIMSQILIDNITDLELGKKNINFDFSIFTIEQKRKIIIDNDVMYLIKLLKDRVDKMEYVNVSNITAYSNTNEHEYFAEIFREYFLKRMNNKSILDFFKRFIKIK